MKKSLLLLVLCSMLFLCVEEGGKGACEGSSGISCSGSISKDGTVSLSVQTPSKGPEPPPELKNVYQFEIKNPKVSKAILKECEVTGKLWSCHGSTQCSVLSEKPIKLKCPVSKGNYCVSVYFVEDVTAPWDKTPWGNCQSAGCDEDKKVCSWTCEVGSVTLCQSI
ncbi:MAG: hypothetical protein QXO16_06450 [Archaeoglobaceae archaeon]